MAMEVAAIPAQMARPRMYVGSVVATVQVALIAEESPMVVLPLTPVEYVAVMAKMHRAAVLEILQTIMVRHVVRTATP